MAKKKFLKTLLTTASGLAVMTSLAGDAWGAVRTTTAAAGVKEVTEAGDWDNAPVDDDSLKYGGDNQTINLNGAGGANNFQEVDLDGKTAPVLTVVQNVSLGAIGNAAVDANKAVININNGKSLTLTSRTTSGITDYTGLKTIALDAAGSGAVVINKDGGGNTTLDANFTGAANDGGLIITTSLISNSTSVASFKNIGIAAVQSLTIDGTKDLEAAGAGKNLEVSLNAAGGVITFADAASKLVLKNTSADAAGKNDNLIFKLGGDINPGGADRGILELSNTTDGEGILILQGEGGLRTLGTATKELAGLNISGANNGRVQIAHTISVANVNADVNVFKGATLIYSNQANALPGGKQFKIGADDGVNGKGAATLILDVEPENIAFVPAKFSFEDAGSVLEFGFSDQTADKTVTLGDDFNPPADGEGSIIFRQFGAGHKLTLTGNKQIGDPLGNKFKEIVTDGTVVFADDVTGVGANKLTVKNGSLTVRSKGLGVGQIAFDSDGSDGAKLDLGNTDISGISFVNNTQNTNTIITSNNNLNIDTAFGTASNPIGNIEMSNPAAQTINIKTADFFGGITTSSNGAGTVNVDVASPNLGALGESNAKLGTVNINENSTVSQSLYSNNVNVAAGKKLAVSGGGFGASLINLQGAVGDTNAQIDLPDGDINFNIRTTDNNTGIVNLTGGSRVVTNSIGQSGARLKEIHFESGDKTVSFAGADLFAENVKLNNGTYSLKEDMTIDGGLQLATGSVLDFGTNQLTLKDGTSSFSGDIAVSTTLNADGTALGNAISENSVLKFNALNSLVITINDSSVEVTKNQTLFDFITVNGGSVEDVDKAVGKFTINNEDTKFSQWTIVHTPGSNKISLSRANNSGNALEQSIKNVGGIRPSQDLLNFISNVTPGSEGAKFVSQLNSMNDTSRADAANRVESAGQAAQQAISDVQLGVATNIGNRFSDISVPQVIQVADQSSMVTGVAAGDNLDKYGVWFSPFYEDATQKKRSSTAGYKSKSAGATVGFDFMANDDVVLGAAATYVNTDLKYKDFKRGDKASIESFLGSLYGLWNLSSEYYVQGAMTFGTSKIKNTDLRRVSNTSLQTARGKNNAMSFSGELIGGYNFAVDNKFLITPQAGFGFNKVNDSSYKESGVEGQSLDVNRKSTTKVNAILGLRATATPYEYNGMEVTPEAHVVMRHDLRGDRAKVESSLNRGVAGESNVLSSRAPKVNKTYFNLGAGANFKYNNYDYGVNYDATLASKYVAHQGSLKIRVNF